MAGVLLDLRAVQSRHHRDRGIARYAAGFATAVWAGHRDLVAGVVLDPAQPVPAAAAGLADAGLAVSAAEAAGTDPDAYHVLSPYELDLPLAELWPRPLWARRLPLVVTLYDLIPEVFPQWYLADPGTRARYRARHQLVRAADAVLTLSASAAADAVDRLGVDPGRVTVVGAAVDPRFAPPPDAAAARAAARRAVAGLGDRVVVYNGAVEPRKNMDGLLEAFARLPAGRRAGWQLVLVCRLDDLQRHHYEVEAARLGVADAVLLTGFLPDEALVALYQAADLAVFPSRYEGYGLPVAEAMACGAPVVAAGNSSLAELVPPEATFDAADVDAIAAVLGRALGDPAWRRELAAWSRAHPPTGWAAVADAAAAAYRGVLARPAAAPGAGHAWRPRPRLAVVTPWPPAPSGVADYSARLVAALRAEVDVDVLADGDDRPAYEPDGPGPLAPAAQLPVAEALRAGYDAVVHCLGNSPYHVGALRLLERRPGRDMVLAHEVRLAGLWFHATARGQVAGDFAARWAEVRPGEAPPLDPTGWLDADRVVAAGVTLVEPVLALAGRFCTTSAWAADAVRAAAPELAGRVVDVGFGCPEPGPADRPDEEGLVCSFGVVHDAKCPAVLVDAAAHLAAGRPGLRLVLVGPVSAEGRRAVEAAADDAGLGGRVTLTGRVAEAEYRRWLGRAAVAVQLRAYSNGERSAAVADCLAAGVPTVVTTAGPDGELAGGPAAGVAAGADGAAVAAVVGPLLDDAATRAGLGARGRAYAAGHGFDRAARRLLDQVPGPC